MLRERCNESVDTFSFALVLLCLVVGDIGFVAKMQARVRVFASSGWRPIIPTQVSKECPDLAALISDMWGAEFRKRPSMASVVARLEECTFGADLDQALLFDSRKMDEGLDEGLDERFDSRKMRSGDTENTNRRLLASVRSSRLTPPSHVSHAA